MRNKNFYRLLVLFSIITILATWWFQPAAPVNSQIFPTFPIITLQPTLTPVPVSIGNFAWDDLDQDGIQDVGEPGLGGVTVQLWNSAGTQMINQYTTGAAGFYQVAAPGEGDYRIRAILPGAMDTFSPKHQGSDTTKDSDINPSGTHLGFSDIFTIPSNVASDFTHDVGVVVFRTTIPTPLPNPINIGNWVWHDLNQNGIQDAGENGVSDVNIQLWNSTKTQMIVQITTGPSGLYQLTAPYPGDYRILFLPPIGSSFSPKDQGANDDKDSDANPSGANQGFTDIFTLTGSVTSIINIDTGLKVVGAIPTPTPPPPGGIKIFLPIIKR